MTLDEINRSDAGFRARIDSAFKAKDCQTYLDALKEDILEGLERKPVIEAGESAENSIARWHTYLSGKYSIIKSIERIASARPVTSATQERPYEHALPPHLQKLKETLETLPQQVTQPKRKTK